MQAQHRTLALNCHSKITVLRGIPNKTATKKTRAGLTASLVVNARTKQRLSASLLARMTVWQAWSFIACHRYFTFAHQALCSNYVFKRGLRHVSRKILGQHGRASADLLTSCSLACRIGWCDREGADQHGCRDQNFFAHVKSLSLSLSVVAELASTTTVPSILGLHKQAKVKSAAQLNGRC